MIFSQKNKDILKIMLSCLVIFCSSRFIFSFDPEFRNERNKQRNIYIPIKLGSKIKSEITPVKCHIFFMSTCIGCSENLLRLINTFAGYSESKNIPVFVVTNDDKNAIKKLKASMNIPLNCKIVTTEHIAITDFKVEHYPQFIYTESNEVKWSADSKEALILAMEDRLSNLGIKIRTSLRNESVLKASDTCKN
jgi:hypothetical protein